MNQQDALVNSLLGHTTNWLNKANYGAPQAPTLHSWQRQPNDQAIAEAKEGTVAFNNDFLSRLHRLGGALGNKRGQLVQGDVEGARVLLHEVLHQNFTQRPGYMQRYSQDRGAGRQEEMSAESVASDLLPAFLKQMYGHKEKSVRPNGATAYANEVETFRQASTVGSGAGNWRKPKARQWRREFYQKNIEDRRAMMDEVVRLRGEQDAQGA